MRRTSALLVAAGCLAAGCGASSDSPTSQDDEVRYAVDGTFTRSTPADPVSFDPYHSPGALGYDDLLYDPLVNLTPDGEFVSGLAEEWTVDATTATFTLRDDVTCSDGSPLTASQVAADIAYVSDPANGAVLYGLHTPTVPITATGDDAARTVTVTAEQPFGFLLETVGVLPIVCAKGMQDRSLLEAGSDGTGPFVLTDVAAGQTFTFTRRDDYAWGPDGVGTDEPGTPKTVVVRVIPDETTAANLLLSGELNFAQITGDDHQRLDAEGLDKDQGHSGVALWFNQRDGRVTQDEDVRRALAQALDLGELVPVATGGTGTAATGLVALDPNVCDGDTVSGQLPEFDVAAAEALLDEAGWVRGPDGVRAKDGTPLTIDLHAIPTTNRYDQPTAELVADRWEQLGVTVDLSLDGPNGYTEVALGAAGNWDVFVLGYGFYLPSQWIPYVSGPVPPDGVNVSGIQNEDYLTLVAQAQTLTAPDSCTYWNQAEQALLHDVNTLPIAFRPSFYYLRGAEAEVSGFSIPIPTSIRVFEE